LAPGFFTGPIWCAVCVQPMHCSDWELPVTVNGVPA
jgi:hypothetical protein